MKRDEDMLNYNVKIGLVPLRRDCTPRPGQFNWEIAEERGRNTVEYIKKHFSWDEVVDKTLEIYVKLEEK